MSQISQRRRDTTDGSASRRQQPAGVDVGGGPSLPLGTQWDLALSHLLMPALEAYEQVRDGLLTCSSLGGGGFRQLGLVITPIEPQPFCFSASPCSIVSLHLKYDVACIRPLFFFQEAITGEVAPGNAEFQQGIRRAVPLGWIFKGFPLHQHHLCPKQTLQSLIDEPQVRTQRSTYAAKHRRGFSRPSRTPLKEA